MRLCNRHIADTGIRPLRQLAAGLALAVAAGCSGNHAPVSPIPPTAAFPTKQRVDFVPSAIPRGTAEFVITIDRKAKNLLSHSPSYVSTKTQSMKIEQTFPRKKTYVVPLAPNAKGCRQAKTVLTCTVDETVEAGYQNFQITLYASKNAKGPLLSEGQATGSVSENRKTKFRMVLDAVVASMSSSVQALTMPNDGQKHTLGFTVGMLDAAGASIVGGATLRSSIQATQTAGSYGLGITPSNIQKIPKSDVIPISVSYDGSYENLTATTITFDTYNNDSKTTALLRIPFATLQASPKMLPGFVMGGATPVSAGVSESGFGGVFKIQNNNPAVVTVSCAPASCAPTTAGGTVDLSFKPLQVGEATVSIGDALGSNFTYSYTAVGLKIYTAPVTPGRIDNMTAGADGNLWGVVESGGSGEIAQIAPSTGAPTYYSLPAPFDPTHSPAAVAGPDNAIWLIDEHSPYLYRVSTAAATVGQVTTVGSADGADPTAIVLGLDKQTLYYTDSHGNVDTYNVVTKVGAFSINPYDDGTTATISLTQDPANGSIYFTDSENLYKLANGVVTNLAGYISVPPQILSMGPDGNLWYTQSGQITSVGGVQPYLCKFVPSVAAGSSNPTCWLNTLSWSINSFEFGPDGAAWIVGVDGSQNVQILRSTTTNIQTYFSGATCCPVSNGIATGPDGALWVATTAGVNRFALTQAEAAVARGGVSRDSVPKARVTPRPKR